MLAPAPVDERAGVELQQTRRRGEAAQDLPVDLDTDGATALVVGVRRTGRREVLLRRLRVARVDAPVVVDTLVRRVLLGTDRRLVQRTDARTDLERAVATHVLEAGEPLLRGLLLQPRHRVVEHPAVVLVDAELRPRLRLRLEVLADAERPVGVDAPRQLDPELVLLPHLARVDLAGVGDRLTEALARGAQHRLAEREPLRVVLLVARDVVPLARHAHREDEVGEVRGLVPRGRERDVQPDLAVVGEHLDPAEPVGVRPDRVVDAREVDVDQAAALLHEVREEERQLVLRDRVLERVGELVPRRRVVREVDRARDELVPCVGVGAAGHRDRAHERTQHEQRARDLPAALVAGRGGAPRVDGEAAARLGDGLVDGADLCDGDARLLRRELEGVLGVDIAQHLLERLEGGGTVRVLLGEVLLPVPPATHVVAVVVAVRDELARDGQQDRGLAARVGRHPLGRVRRRVGQTYVHDDELRAAVLRLDDALRVRVEVVARLEVRRDEQDRLRVRMVRARTVDAAPELEAGASAGGADVRVRVVTVDAPRGEHALREAVLTGATHVVHHLVVASGRDRRADAQRDLVERLVPADALPATLATVADAPHRVEDAVRVGDLVVDRGALRAVASARTRRLGVALELADLQRVLVDVGEEPTGGLAVEARRRDEHEALLDPPRPCAAVELDPVVPALLRREHRELAARRTLVEGLAASLRGGTGGVHPCGEAVEVCVHPVLLVVLRHVVVGRCGVRSGGQAVRRAGRTARPGRRRARRPRARRGRRSPPAARAPVRPVRAARRR